MRVVTFVDNFSPFQQVLHSVSEVNEYIERLTLSMETGSTFPFVDNNGNRCVVRGELILAYVVMEHEPQPDTLHDLQAVSTGSLRN